MAAVCDAPGTAVGMRTNETPVPTTPRAPTVGRVVRPVLVACALVLAGCSGTLVEYAASPAVVPDAALGPRGYVHGNTTEVPITYRVGGGALSQDITLITWVSGYTRTTADDGTTDDGTTDDGIAVLVLYSSPNVQVADRSVNPLGQLSNRELVRTVLDRGAELRGLGGVEGLSDLREHGAQNVTMLGTPVQAVSYVGTADIDGRRIAVVVNIAVVEHEGDVVVALGVHDETRDETATHVALIERVEH